MTDDQHGSRASYAAIRDYIQRHRLTTSPWPQATPNATPAKAAALATTDAQETMFDTAKRSNKFHGLVAVQLQVHPEALRDLMARMGQDSERAAMIYQHEARGADQKTTNAIDAHVETERGQDDDGSAGAFVPAG